MPVYDFSFAIAEGIGATVVPGANAPMPTITNQTISANEVTAGTLGYGSPLSALLTAGANLGPNGNGTGLQTWNSAANSPFGQDNQYFYQNTLYSYSVVNPACSNKWVGSANATKIAQALLGLPQPIYNFQFNVFLTKNDIVGAPSGAQLSLNFPLTGRAGYYNGTPGVYRNCPVDTPTPTTPGVPQAITNAGDIPMEIPVYINAPCINPISGQSTVIAPTDTGVFRGTVVGTLSDGVYLNAVGFATKSLNATGNPIYTVHVVA